MKRFIRISAKIIGIGTAGIIGLFLLLTLLLQFQWVQNKLIPIAENAITSATGAEVEIASVDIALPFYLRCKHIKMYDLEGKPMLKLSELKVNLLDFSIVNYLLHPSQKHRLSLSVIQLKKPEILLYKRAQDSLYNFSFLLPETEAEASGESNLGIRIGSIQIQDGRFHYIDYTQPDSLTKDGAFSVQNISLSTLNANFSFEMMPNGNLKSQLWQLSFLEQNSGFQLNDLQTTFSLENKPEEQVLALLNTQLQIEESKLAFSALYHSPHDTGREEKYTLSFFNSSLDLPQITSYFGLESPVKEKLKLSGTLEGNLNTLHTENLLLTLPGGTALKPDIEIESLKNLAFKVDFNDSKIAQTDFKSFFPGIPVKKFDTFVLSGTVKGNQNRLNTKSLTLKYGSRNAIILKATAYQYLDPENIMLDLRVKESGLHFADLSNMIPQVSLPEWLANLGQSTLNGHFVGGLSDFVIDAECNSQIGSLAGNIHIILPPRAQTLEYDGRLKTNKLNVTTLGVSESFQSEYLNFDGKVRGKGTEVEEIFIALDGKATESDFFGHHIDELKADSIKIEGLISTGEVEVKDQEGDASFYVSFDQTPGAHQYKFKGDVKHINLKHYLNFYGIPTDTQAFVSTFLNVKVEGDSLDNLTGKIQFLFIDLYKVHVDQRLSLNNVILKTTQNTSERRDLEFTSSLFDADYHANCDIATSFSLLQRLAGEVQLYMANNDSLTKAYYAGKAPDSAAYTMSYSLQTKEMLTPMLQFWGSPLKMVKNARMKAEYTTRPSEDIQLNLTADSLQYNEMHFVRPVVDLNFTKDPMANSLIAVAGLQIDTATLAPGVKFESLRFEPQLLDQEVSYFFQCSQQDLGNTYRLDASTRFYDDKIVTRINPRVSLIQLQDQEWVVRNENKVEVKAGKIFVDELTLFNKALEQEIALKGVISDQVRDEFSVMIDNLHLESVLRFYEGLPLISGTVQDFRADFYGLLRTSPRMTVSSRLEGFQYEAIDSVDIQLDGNLYNNGENKIVSLRTLCKYRNRHALSLSGTYDLTQKALNFRQDSARLPLKWASPFLEGVASGLKGNIELTDLIVEGSLKKVRWSGAARFQNVGMHIDYLGADIGIKDGAILRFDKKNIFVDTLNPIVLIDKDKNTAKLSYGMLTFDGFENISYDLRLREINDFIFMNTRRKDNELFYGKVVVKKGEANVKGSMGKVSVQADVTTGEDTWLDIPLADYTEATRLDYVQFVGGESSILRRQKTDLTGYEVNLNVRATPDAKVRIILNEQAGDIIEGTGEGDLSLTINESGEFVMYGTYTVQSGGYLFTAENIVNKKFTVEQGGKISWSGDPYEAEMDISALYKVNADASSILGDDAGRVPVDIIMNLKGSLLQPEIQLSLRQHSGTGSVTELESYFRNIQFDQQELNKQVVSLLMFRRFAANSQYFAGSNGGGAGGGVTSSLSELISNQVNYWLSQAFNSANVGVEFNTDEFENLELGVEWTLFDDKVKVERHGTLLGNQRGQLSVGDISVLIKLLPTEKEKEEENPVPLSQRGQLVLEIFNRENSSFNNTNSSTTGAGLFFKKDFNHFSELFGRRKKPFSWEESDSTND